MHGLPTILNQNAPGRPETPKPDGLYIPTPVVLPPPVAVQQPTEKSHGPDQS